MGAQLGTDTGCDNLEHLMVCAQRGEISALGSLRKATGAKLFATAYRLLGNRADADEVVGDVYIRVWYSKNSFDPNKGDVQGWLATICRNASIDLLRRRQRLQCVPLAESRSVADSTASPEQILERSELAKLLCRAIEQLPGLQRQLLGLSFHSGLSHRQISNTYNVPLGTVKSHLNRTLKRLEREMRLLRVDPEQSRSRFVLS